MRGFFLEDNDPFAGHSYQDFVAHAEQVCFCFVLCFVFFFFFFFFFFVLLIPRATRLIPTSVRVL
jgi:hypothetical protein